MGGLPAGDILVVGGGLPNDDDVIGGRGGIPDGEDGFPETGDAFLLEVRGAFLLMATMTETREACRMAAMLQEEETPPQAAELLLCLGKPTTMSTTNLC
mmetsp:Transcript_16734/g.34280  ORF Transcript_16734/g.34280 Transcript_16734/m.34280 type:complete len:99 (+) Transcript_16734:1367-1663(+)